MPDKYAIRYLPAAVDDLLAIYDWIADDILARAVSFADKLDKRISSLATHAFLNRIPKNDKLRSFGYRVLVVDSFLAFYVVRGHIIEIHRVVHGSRLLDDIV